MTVPDHDPAEYQPDEDPEALPPDPEEEYDRAATEEHLRRWADGEEDHPGECDDEAEYIRELFEESAEDYLRHGGP